MNQPQLSINQMFVSRLNYALYFLTRIIIVTPRRTVDGLYA